MAAKDNVSDAADREIHMPHPIHRIVCTYSHTFTSPTSCPYLQTYITFRGVYSALPPPLSRPVPPHPLLPSLYGRQQCIVSCRCPLFSMGGYVCMQAWLCGGMYVCMYVCRKKKSQHFFSLSSSFSSLDRPRRCFQIYHLMDLCAGDALRVSFCRLDLTLLLFRAKRRTKVADLIVEAAFAAVSHHSNPRQLIPCCVCSVFASSHACASSIERVYVCERSVSFRNADFGSVSLWKPRIRACPVHRGPLGRRLVRIVSTERSPDLCCAVLCLWCPR
jgi:hypothetical protein